MILRSSESNESVSHLLFQCSLAKAVWAIVAHCLGASNVPRNFNQCWAWCEQWLPYGNKFHAIGIAAICWAIWKTRNSARFEGKVVTSPIHILYVMLVCLWSTGQVYFWMKTRSS